MIDEVAVLLIVDESQSIDETSVFNKIQKAYNAGLLPRVDETLGCEDPTRIIVAGPLGSLVAINALIRKSFPLVTCTCHVDQLLEMITNDDTTIEDAIFCSNIGEPSGFHVSSKAGNC